MSTGSSPYAKWCRLVTVTVSPAKREAFLAAMPDQASRCQWDEVWSTLNLCWGEDESVPNRFHIYEEIRGPCTDDCEWDDDAPQPDGLLEAPTKFAAAIALTEEGALGGPHKCGKHAALKASCQPHQTRPSPLPMEPGTRPLIRATTVVVKPDQKNNFLPIARSKLLCRRAGTDFCTWGEDLEQEGTYHFFEVFRSSDDFKTFVELDEEESAWPQYAAANPTSVQERRFYGQPMAADLVYEKEVSKTYQQQLKEAASTAA